MRILISFILMAVFTATTAFAYAPLNYQPKRPEIWAVAEAPDNQEIIQIIAQDVQKLFKTAVKNLGAAQLEETLKAAYELYFKKLMESGLIYEAAFVVDMDGPTFFQAYIRIKHDDTRWQHIWIGEKPKDPPAQKKKLKIPAKNSRSYSV